MGEGEKRKEGRRGGRGSEREEEVEEEGESVRFDDMGDNNVTVKPNDHRIHYVSLMIMSNLTDIMSMSQLRGRVPCSL